MQDSKLDMENIIASYIPKEIKTTEEQIMGILEAADCSVNHGKTIADLKEKIGYIRGLKTIFELPKKIRKQNELNEQKKKQ
jgi:hypothetical protein